MTSADITRELRGARPAAPEALRDRVRAIVTAEPPPRPSFGARLAALRPRGPRPLLALVPVAAVAVALTAGLVQLVRPGGEGADLASPPSATEAFRDGAGTQDAAGPETAGGAGDAAAAGAAKQSAAPAPAGPAVDRAQRTSVRLSLSVPDGEAVGVAAQRAVAATRALGGYVVSSQVATSETGSGSLVVKIPSDRVQDAIARLSALGTVTAQDVRVDDLQESLDAVERRIAVLRTRIAALTARLAAPGISTEERARLESTRRALRDALAGDRGSSRAIRAEAAFATVELTIATAAEEEAVPAAPSRFDRALDDVVAILAVEGVVVLYALVVLLPLALGGLLVGLAARALVRRGRDRLLGVS